MVATNLVVDLGSTLRSDLEGTNLNHFSVHARNQDSVPVLTSVSDSQEDYFLVSDSSCVDVDLRS